MNKIILDLCGGTGAWSEPYKNAGYDVRNITLPIFDVREVFLRGDNHFVFPSNESGKFITADRNKIYGILAAPPCTQFSLARTTAKTPRDFKEGMELVIACLKIIWECRYRNKLGFWALENPKAILRQFLGKPAFTFQQWEFEDFGIKPTDVWGYFKNPIKKCKERPNGMTKKYPCGSSNLIGWGKLTARKKAITPQGFAKAFFESNK